jgi:hypothetical protein
MLNLAIRSEIPDLDWPIRDNSVPTTMAVMDLLEFCHQHIAKPIREDYHTFYSHHHLGFDRDKGQAQFRKRANLILSRNNLAFEVNDDGSISRIAPPVLQDVLISLIFDSGDGKLDELLTAARTKFLHRDSAVHREALEKLWDAWERVKTLEPGTNKKESAKVMLDKAAPEPKFRELIEQDARALTDVGNRFHIRHSEIDQFGKMTNDQVNYLFHRLFALIWLVLQAR